MSTFLYIIEIAIALGLVIFVHELGHFLAAKRFGVYVRRFAIGLGPAILKWRRGETEYSLRWIPVGGFVDLMGEHPEAESGDDPRALCNKPPWQRIVVFAAGVAMNVVLALVLFAVAPILGIRAPTPVVGEVMPASPAAQAGIRPGDRILAIDDEPVACFFDVQMAISLRDAGSRFSLLLERPAEAGGAPERLTKTLTSMRGDLMPVIGIGPAAQPVLDRLLERSPAAQAGLRRKDRILAVAGTPVAHWHEAVRLLKEQPAGPVELVIEREGRRETLTVRPADIKEYQLGMGPPAVVAAVLEDSPAEKAGLRGGDRVVRVGDLAWPGSDDLHEAVQKAGAGGQVALEIERETGLLWWRRADLLTVTVAPALMGEDKKPRVGIHMAGHAGPPLRVGRVDPDGAAAAAGLERGDVILSVLQDETVPSDWGDLERLLLKHAVEEPVPMRIERQEQPRTLQYQVGTRPAERLSLENVAARPEYVDLPRITSPVTAISRGLKRTVLWLGRVYGHLKQMVRGEVSVTTVGGPVLAVAASLEVAAQGPGTLMELWGMLAVSIAVLNFLPLPPFDGGHALFVLIEAAKRRPVSLRARTAIWTVAWAGILMLFVALLWLDISRVIDIYF